MGKLHEFKSCLIRVCTFSLKRKAVGLCLNRDPHTPFSHPQAVIEAGATTINLPDTVGYTLPDEYSNMFTHLIANVRKVFVVSIIYHLVYIYPIRSIHNYLDYSLPDEYAEHASPM